MATQHKCQGNVQGEPVFSVMAANCFCETGALEKKRISPGLHFEEKVFYPDELWNRWIPSNLIHLGPDIIWF